MKSCNLHRISPNQIPKFTESDSWNEVATRTNNLNVMSCLFHVSPLAPPSHNVLPVTSLPSLGPGPLFSFASTEAPAASSAWTTFGWPFRAAIASGPLPRSGGLGCRWRRDAPSHMSCFGGFPRISGLKNWEFGPPFHNFN